MDYGPDRAVFGRVMDGCVNLVQSCVAIAKHQIGVCELRGIRSRC